MATNYVDPVTGIVVPTPEQEPGPQYAQDISDALLTLAHLTHTGAANLDGYQIPSAGIDFNEDISAQSNNLTTLRSTRYDSQDATLGGVGDLNCLYFVNGDAYVNDGNGTPIRLTSGGTIVVISSNNLNSLTLSTNHTINSSDTYAVFNYDNYTGNKTITLPVANTVPNGRFYYVKDLEGLASTSTITVNPSGSDTIDEASSYVINWNYGAVLVMSDGVSNWQLYAFSSPNLTNREYVTIGSTPATDGYGVRASYPVAASTYTGLTVRNNNNTANIRAIGVDRNNYVQVSRSNQNAHIGGSVSVQSNLIDVAFYTVDVNGNSIKDYVLFCDTSIGAIEITLPTLQFDSRVLKIKDIAGMAATNNITITQASGETIEGIAVPYVMDANMQCIELTSDSNSNWWITGTV